MTSLSIIIPTLGRETLAATLRSIEHQLGPRDEVILVADRSNGDAELTRRLVVDQFNDCRWRYAEIDNPAADVGYTQRNYGMLLARGSHLAFVDDDDTYRPGALRLMCTAARLRPTLFRIRHPLLGVIWQNRKVAYGNVSTQMLVVPNDPEKLPEWGSYVDGRGGDYRFIADCTDALGPVEWRTEVIADLSPAGVAAGSHVMGAPA